MSKRMSGRERLKEISKKIKGLSEEDREKLKNSVGILTIEGKKLSIRNNMLLAIQSSGKATIVGGYKQWLKSGRKVKKGEHGYLIYFPVKKEGEIENFYIAVVFDINQTEEILDGNIDKEDKFERIESSNISEKNEIIEK